MDASFNVEEEEKPPMCIQSMASQEYVSMFRIDGKPILPPLMTIEKRYEMQMYREKAIQLERRYQQAQQGKRVQFIEESPRSPMELSNSDNTSLRSSDGAEDAQQSETENDESCTPHSTTEISPKILVNIGCNTDQFEEATKSQMDNSTNTTSTETPISEKSLSQRVSELSKSETVMFDLVAQTVLTAANTDKVNEEKQRRQEKQAASEEDAHIKAEKIRDLIEISNLLRSQPKQSLFLPLQKRSEPSILIPSICVNPPTPLIGPINICDSTLSGSESVDSFNTSGFQSSQAEQHQPAKITEGNSTDDSCNTHSTEHIGLVTPQKKITNITAKILKFEQGIQNTPGNTISHVEDEQYFISRPPQRSATSPSLKSFTETVNTNSLTTTPRTEDTSTSSLVRSSSFTLEAPSKVLIEHMQKQYERSFQNSNEHDALNLRLQSGSSSTNKRRGTPSPSACRDTIESKAKRVQKKLDFKPSSRQGSSSRSKSKSNFNNYPNSTEHLWNSPIPPVKLKKSPYDPKGLAAQSKTKNNGTQKHQMGSTSKASSKSLSKSHKSHSIKKTASSTTYTVRPNALTTTKHTLLNNNNDQSSSQALDVMSEIENRHRQKLNSLLAQQREEERRLQQLFNVQREMLLNQLSSEMNKMNIDAGLGVVGVGISNQRSTNLQIEGHTIGSPIFNGNTHKSYTANASLERVSPTLSVTSSYVPSFGNNLGGFTTTTLASCDVMPLEDNSTASSTLTEHSTRRVQRILKGTTFRSPNAQRSPKNSPGEKCSSKILLHEYDTDMDRRNAAASIINACARGFLVRRLFQTEQIQRIVQTIRDTLIFVLNLHMETMDDPEEANTEANIKLKARLLQQLASASRTLHLIFFQTSVKERMEIISRDRKRIKTKLLSMSLKRSPRIA